MEVLDNTKNVEFTLCEMDYPALSYITLAIN